MIKDVLMLSFELPALVYETPPPQTPLRWLGQSVSHGVVLEPLELGSLGEEFGISAISKRLEPCDGFKLLNWR